MPKFPSSASRSVSKVCNRDGSAAPRSQIFSEPISRKVGSRESCLASFTSSYPARRLYSDYRSRSAKDNRALFALESVKCCSISSPNPRRSSNSRTRIRLRWPRKIGQTFKPGFPF